MSKHMRFSSNLDEFAAHPNTYQQGVHLEEMTLFSDFFWTKSVKPPQSHRTVVALFQPGFLPSPYRLPRKKIKQLPTHRAEPRKPFLDVVVFWKELFLDLFALIRGAVWKVGAGGIFPNNLNRSLMDDLMKIWSRFLSNDNLSSPPTWMARHKLCRLI